MQSVGEVSDLGWYSACGGWFQMDEEDVRCGKREGAACCTSVLRTVVLADVGVSRLRRFLERRSLGYGSAMSEGDVPGCRGGPTQR